MTPSDDIVIRFAERGDVDAIEQIAQQSCKNPWNYQQLHEELDFDFTYLYCAELDGEVVGFADMHIAGGDAHINEIAVRGVYRRRGIGDRLMHACIEEAMRQECGVLTLEVREKNLPARGLYESLGFSIVGVRPRFYKNPDDNAVVMRMNLGEDILDRFYEE